MGNYQEARVKLTYSKLNKLKSAAKNKAGARQKREKELSR